MAHPHTQSDTPWSTPASGTQQRHDPEAHPNRSAPDPTGRRKFPRTDIRLAVQLFMDAHSYIGISENMSAGGVFVAVEAPLTIGDTVDVTITLQNSSQIIAHGVVRWVRDSSATGLSPGLGIQFLQLEGEHLFAGFFRSKG